ncbi:hypothetical protein TVAG_434320 [Trichomonas vaginalis G3]|uniref:Uncharacterized protein n=1 Tax=Trichomonas vaginalis (strain ATCC PRA-98 / G3) TaxID=412133 RepID=A2DSL5_TRIV3|nr:Histone deacetylation protein Rxt3 family [Trichomonas vaginalis G3]EAY16595.1 hypothetical protein TVAG_434320 [Trichomonas vaginalis G3]KAI5532973.1 Histone deacetylation protein Rxt3 family [Trichomonas vaginalis G3]|eukprot:XP_001328818.1 hypothetical protein [Trichomonas vaginalis G3]
MIKNFDGSFPDPSELVLEYTPTFDLSQFKPQVGDIFRFYISERFFLNSNTNITSRNISGTTFYTPNSDIVDIAIHCGCLFAHPKSSGLTRRWCTVLNFFEALCNEDKYQKVAEVIELSNYAQVKGLLLDILIDNTLPSYYSSTRNGLKSKSFNSLTDYSIRVINYKILTKFDRIPRIAEPSKYVRSRIKMPVFKFAFNREIGVNYSIEVFSSLFNPETINNDFFTIYRLFFDINQNRYEIRYSDEDGNFWLTQLENPIDVKELKTRKSKKTKEKILFDRLTFFDIVPTPTGINVKGTLFEPISTILVPMFYGKILIGPKAKISQD